MKPVFEQLSVSELFSKGFNVPAPARLPAASPSVPPQVENLVNIKKGSAVTWLIIGGIGLLILGAVLSNMAQTRRRIAEQTLKSKYNEND